MTDVQQPSSTSDSLPSITEPAVPTAGHRPKIGQDLRGWLKEIGIVVIGVMLALGAGQLADAIHWRQQVDTSEETLRDNVRVMLAAAAEREAQSPCLGRRLAALAEVIDEASSSGRLPAIGQLGSPSRSSFNFASWDSLIAAQVTPHLTRDQMGNYAGIASVLAMLRKTNEDETADWAVLYSVVGPGRRFGDAEQATIRAALSRAVLAAKTLRTSAELLVKAVTDSGLLTSAEIMAVRRKAGEEYTIYARDGVMCKPLKDAPRADHYGQAPSPVDLSKPFQP